VHGLEVSSLMVMGQFGVGLKAQTQDGFCLAAI